MATLQSDPSTRADDLAIQEEAPLQSAARTPKTSIWRALQHRNYRLFFSGQIVSLAGSWMTQLAMSWLVYRLTKSVLLLGVIGFVGQIPSFFIAPFAGVWLDRQNRHRVLIFTQALAMAQSLALAALFFLGVRQVEAYVALAGVQGLINAFDMPARQAFVVEMVDDRVDLNNAIALNSSMVNMARLVGPALAGVLIRYVGEGFCFLIDGLSYIAVIASLMMMRIAPRPIEIRTENAWQSLRGGLNYIITFQPIRAVLLLLAFTSLTGISYVTLVPVIVRDVLNGNAGTQGLLMVGSGIGALTGALYLASRKSVVGLGNTLIRAPLMLGIGLMALAFSRNEWLSFFILMLTGGGTIGLVTAGNTLVQTLVEDSKRSRVMSFFTVAFMGMSPFGSLLAGSMAHRFGVPNTLLMGAACCAMAALWFALQLPELRRLARPRLITLGILAAES